MDSEAVWAAGLFEGEGTINVQRRIGRRGQPRLCLQVALQMTDEDVVRRFAAAVKSGSFYGPYPRPERRKDLWRWQAYGRAAQAVVLLLLPQLCERRRATAVAALAEVYPDGEPLWQEAVA